jgi:hemolysin activation/secretion protein
VTIADRARALALCVIASFALSAGWGEGAVEQKATFDIYEYEIAGVSVLPQTQIEKAVYPYLGPGKTIEDVEKARAALEQVYHQAGYGAALVDIPEQQVTQGIVRLRVTESRVGRTRVVGAMYYSQGRILSQAPALKEGEVLNFTAVQQQIADMNDRPQRRVIPVLRPGPRFGTTDADLNVEDKLPLHANLELNNYYSPNTTELRLLAGARYDNLWQLDHSIGVQVQTSPQDTSEVKVFSASYYAPLWGNASGGAYYVRSNSNVAAVGDLTVLGNGDIVGLRLVQPLRPIGSFGEAVTFGADYKSFSNVVVQPGTPGVQTPIQYTDLMVSYGGNFVKPTYSTTLSTGITFSVRGISASDAQFEANRFNAASNFFIWKFDVQHTHAVYRGWSVYGRLDGQLTGQPLVSTEQYAAGGADNVRGYLQAEALGDNALHTTLELRSPSFGPRLSSKMQDLTVYGFFDGAELAVVDPLPAQQYHMTLASVGIGLRARALDAVTLRLDVGVALKPTIYTSEGEVRVQFSAAYQN